MYHILPFALKTSLKSLPEGRIQVSKTLLVYVEVVRLFMKNNMDNACKKSLLVLYDFVYV